MNLQNYRARCQIYLNGISRTFCYGKDNRVETMVTGHMTVYPLSVTDPLWPGRLNQSTKVHLISAVCFLVLRPGSDHIHWSSQPLWLVTIWVVWLTCHLGAVAWPPCPPVGEQSVLCALRTKRVLLVSQEDLEEEHLRTRNTLIWGQNPHDHQHAPLYIEASLTSITWNQIGDVLSLVR